MTNTNAAVAADLRNDIIVRREWNKTHPESRQVRNADEEAWYEAKLESYAKDLDAGFDLIGILAMDKKALRAVPEGQLQAVRDIVSTLSCASQRKVKLDWSATRLVQGELRRRTTNASRERNTAARAAAAIPAGTYAVGDKVQVHAMGYWYNGEVVKLGRTGKVTVRYTSGTGVTREKAVDSNKVRKPSK